MLVFCYAKPARALPAVGIGELGAVSELHAAGSPSSSRFSTERCFRLEQLHMDPTGRLPPASVEVERGDRKA